MPGTVYLIASPRPSAMREAFRRARADVAKARPRIAMSYAAIPDTHGVSRVTSVVAGFLLGADVMTFTVAGEPGAMPVADARAIVERADIVFLNGGDPILGARRLAAAGAGEWIRAAHARGAVCMGISAGSMALCAAWGSWERDEKGAPETVACLGVVPGLVVDCHAEADDWEELRAVKAAMGAGGDELMFAGISSGCVLVVRADGSLEWIGSPFVLQ